jgi:hypothetical protein
MVTTLQKPIVLKEFQLRDLVTGLYDTGRIGSRDRKIVWGTKGKRWKRLSDLSSHLSWMKGERTFLCTWIVVEYDVTEVAGFPVTILIKDKSRI